MEATCNDLLAVIKDIPGYQIIMKAVLKHQIQQLVEQLSETTGEQSVLLTASVSDETFSHLGSEFGKNFLNGHDEIKAEFLAFLKSQQTKKAKQSFASVASRSIGMKKRKAMKTTQSSKRGAAGMKSHVQMDLHDEKNDIGEPEDVVQEQSEGTAATEMAATVEPCLEDTTVNSTEPTYVEPSTAAIKGSIESDIYIDNAETMPSDTTQEQSEIAILTSTNHGTAEENTLPVLDPIETPVVGIPKLETDASFQNQRVINCYAVLSDELRANLTMNNVSVKKEEGLDAEEGSDIDEGDNLDKDDSDWEPDMKKRMKSSSSSAGLSLKVSADQGQTTEYVPKGHKKSVSCHYCYKQFPYPSEAKKHERTHTGEKPYDCVICGKSFAISGNLIAHQRIHSGDKPFGCNICEKSFTQANNLVRHQKVHTGVKPYSCKICGKYIARKDSLASHERIHTGIKLKKK